MFLFDQRQSDRQPPGRGALATAGAPGPAIGRATAAS